MKTRIVEVFLLMVLAVSAKANTVAGSIGFATPDLVQADASPTGNINTATTFILQGFSSTNNEAGIFKGLGIQDFGTVILTPTKPTIFDLSDREFGMFSGDSVTKIVNNNGFLNLLITGEWIPGTSEHAIKCAAGGCGAELRMAMTQTPPKEGEISMSGTMSITNTAVVPEPSTGLLFLSGIGMVFAGTKLRKLFA